VIESGECPVILSNRVEVHRACPRSDSHCTRLECGLTYEGPEPLDIWWTLPLPSLTLHDPRINLGSGRDIECRQRCRHSMSLPTTIIGKTEN
jgi:hypothetical protein